MIVLSNYFQKLSLFSVLLFVFLTGNEPYCSSLGMLPVCYDLNHLIPFWNNIRYHI